MVGRVYLTVPILEPIMKDKSPLLVVFILLILTCAMLLMLPTVQGDDGYPGVTPTWGPRPTPTVDWSFATPGSGYQGYREDDYLPIVP